MQTSASPQGKKPTASIRRLQAATEQVLQLGRKSDSQVFLTRGLRALSRLAEDLSPDALTAAAGEATDYAVLLSALGEPEALRELERQDPLIPARLRGLAERQHLLEFEGSPLSGEEVAQLLRITRQAVDKRRRAGRLIGVRIGQRGYAYPSWQFSHEGVLPGLEEVLHDLHQHDVWMQLVFLLNGNSGLDGNVPLEELRQGHLEAVQRAARLYGEQGGV